MPRPRREADEALQALYEQIPDIPNCKGLCWASCGPINMSQRERQRIRQAGFKITDYYEAKAWREEYWCEALGPDGRCQVYDLRPMVCRLWGAVRALRCPYGCVPEGGFLGDGEGRRLLAAAMAAGGGYGREVTAEEEARLMANPMIRELMEKFTAQGTAGDEARIANHGTELPEVVRKRKKRK